MDILNWLYLRKEQLIKTTANNPATDLVAIGADVTFARRDDKYKTYAMPIKDLSVAGDVANTGSYELDLAVTNVVTVTTQKGIIDILGMGVPGNIPGPSYATPELIYINNPELDLTVANREKIYIQYSIYYSPAVDDNAIPYVLTTGAITTGLAFSIFNANPAIAGANNWDGDLYLYYELYTI
jgi:predicted transcriptional regulator